MLKKISLILLFLFSAPLRASSVDPLEGDIIFQRLDSDLSTVIAKATHSKISHVGIILKKDGAWVVIEAIGPVKYTPLQEWKEQGDNKYIVLRLKNRDEAQVQKAISEAKKYLGRPYDIQYELDDYKIYCSELIYKGFLGGANIELGKKQTLGELDWKPHEAFIRKITGGILPLDRVMVTPESVLEDSDLVLVYSNMPQ